MYLKVSDICVFWFAPLSVTERIWGLARIKGAGSKGLNLQGESLEGDN